MEKIISLTYTNPLHHTAFGSLAGIAKYFKGYATNEEVRNALNVVCICVRKVSRPNNFTSLCLDRFESRKISRISGLWRPRESAHSSRNCRDGMVVTDGPINPCDPPTPARFSPTCSVAWNATAQFSGRPAAMLRRDLFESFRTVEAGNVSATGPCPPLFRRQYRNSMSKTLYAIDVFSLVFQVFHAIPPMTGTSGQPTNAVFGFTRDLLTILRLRKPGYRMARQGANLLRGLTPLPSLRAVTAARSVSASDVNSLPKTQNGGLIRRFYY